MAGPASRAGAHGWPGARALRTVAFPDVFPDALPTMGAARIDPLFFGPPQRRLYGCHHAPAEGAARHGVLLVQPLAHEYVHLAVTRKTRNKTPIWLHEGIAKYLETSWRGAPGLALQLPSQALLRDAVKANKVSTLTIGWLVTVARNKLVDHWRRAAREERTLRLATDDEAVDLDLDQEFERAHARHVLAELGAHHRAALTLRYLDGLSVPEVAQHLDRTVHATEALLVRARNAFRARYAEGSDDA